MSAVRGSPGSLPDVTGLDKEFDYLVPEALVLDVRLGSHGARAAARPARRRLGRRARSARRSPSTSTGCEPIAKVSSARARRRADRARPLGVGPLGGRAAAAVPRHGQPADQRRRAAAEPAHRRAAASRPTPAPARCWPTGGGVLRLPPTDDVAAGAARRRRRAARRSSSCRRVDRARARRRRLRRAGLTVAVVPAGLGGRGRRRRRRDRRARRGVGAVPGPRRGRRRRRARRGAAGGAQPDVARPRRRRRAGPARPACRCCWCRRARPSAALAAVGDRLRATGDRRRARRLADRRGRRPQPRRAVEDVARHVAADRPPAGAGPHRGLRAQHRRGGRGSWPAAAAGRWPAASVARPPSGWPTTARSRAAAAARRARPVCLRVRRVGVRQPAPGRDPAARGARGGGRPAGRRGHRARRRAAGRRPACTSAPRRCCTGCRGPTSWRSSTSTPSCWRRATGPPSRRWRCSCAAARLVGPRAGGGRLLVQTFLPRHEVVQAALLADPGRLVEPERARRRLLGLPPFAALAAVSGPGSDEVADALRAVDGIGVGGSDGALHGPGGALGRPRPGPRRRPPPEGLPASASPSTHPARERPFPPM